MIIELSDNINLDTNEELKQMIIQLRKAVKSKDELAISIAVTRLEIKGYKVEPLTGEK